MKINHTKDNAPLAGEAKEALLVSIRNKYRGDSRTDQGSRLLEALRLFPISTFEARKLLDVMHPAGRVQELREDGYCIDSLRTSEPSEIGRPHRIAVYVYRGRRNG